MNPVCAQAARNMTFRQGGPNNRGTDDSQGRRSFAATTNAFDLFTFLIRFFSYDYPQLPCERPSLQSPPNASAQATRAGALPHNPRSAPATDPSLPPPATHTQPCLAQRPCWEAPAWSNSSSATHCWAPSR